MSLFGCKNCNKCNNVDCNKQEFSPDLPKVVLVGNPNVGKSVIFNALSGFYVEVSNYPGTTVDVSRAYTAFGELIDTPGAYILGNYTDDEIVTQNIVKTADIVVNIVSALSIERDLFFTQQLIDMDLPIILVVNQMDEARKRGIEVNIEKLQALLEVKTIGTVAIHNQGIAEIIHSIKNKEYSVSEKKTPFLKDFLKDSCFSRCELFSRILELETHDTQKPEIKDEIYSSRRKTVSGLISQIITYKEKKKTFYDIADDLLLNPFFGTIAAIGVLYVLFQIVGVFVASNIVDFLFSIIHDKYTPWITGVVDNFVHFKSINQLLVGEFGVLTMTVEIVLGILLPLITAFYLFMAFLEDSGYLPRLAVMTDNILNKIGLNGRAVIPLLLGFGCGAMGTITTRILGSKKERTIATAILGITIPCAAQQGIIIALLAAIGGFKVWICYLGIIFMVMVATGTILNNVLKGRATDLIIDLPPLRLPLLYNTLHKTLFRVVNFLVEAVPLFAISSVFISILDMAGFLKWLQKAISPIVVNLLHLPEQFSDVFVMGLIRRDFASIGLLNMAGLDGSTKMLTDMQILVASVVITLFVPCIAALIMIYKERGIKEAALIWLSSFAITIIIGTILSRVLVYVF